MSDLLLIVTLLIWIPLIPLRLMIQSGIRVWRRIGDMTYLFFFIYWGFIDMLLLANRDKFMGTRVEALTVAQGIGTLLIIGSLVFGYWTASTLGFLTFTTRPQVSPEKSQVPLIVSGPYRFLRHPFYFCEWFLLGGVALVTGSWLIIGLLLVTLLLDPIVTFLEEKELVQRFGDDYREYQKKVPRLLPTLAPLLHKGNS